MKKYIPVDLNNAEHKHAYDYYKLAGHPEIYYKRKDVDIDIEFREHLVEKFNLSYDDLCEDANGSTHTVIDDNPNDYKMKLDFFADDESHDFSVITHGKLMFNTKTCNCVFFPNTISITSILPIDDQYT